jgi:hypothetical protein
MAHHNVLSQHRCGRSVGGDVEPGIAVEEDLKWRV